MELFSREFFSELLGGRGHVRARVHSRREFAWL